jgi:hypothetical protein
MRPGISQGGRKGFEFLKSYPYLQRELHKRNENSSLPSQEVNKAP